MDEVRRFQLLDHVRITDGSHAGKEGYVAGSKVEDGLVLYLMIGKVREYWVPEPWLEKVTPMDRQA